MDRAGRACFAIVLGLGFASCVDTAGRAVPYTFDDENNTVAPREIITHTACLPSAITFETGGKTSAVARYETRGGQVFTLKPGSDGAIKVELSAPAAGK